MLIRKMLALEEVNLKMEGEVGTFSGYASVFGGVDSYGDTIVRGAFDYTLKKNGKPRMFFGHDWSFPIGKWTKAVEDEKGLWVEGELTPGLALAADVRAAMLHGTLDGLSIGGYLKAGDYEQTENGRVIRRWSNLVEVSPVVFPADSAARVDPDTVKGAGFMEAIESCETVRDLECLLRDAAGFSRGASTAYLARAKSILGVRDAQQPVDPAMKAIVDRLNAMVESL